jgi:hypothetical protein
MNQPLSFKKLRLFIAAAMKEDTIAKGAKNRPTPPPVRTFPTIAPRKVANGPKTEPRTRPYPISKDLAISISAPGAPIMGKPGRRLTTA